MALAEVSLQDKYTLESGRVYITGVQALVRLPLMQKQRDRAAGLNTAGYISGYRGSPLGGFDQMLSGQDKLLREHDIVFRPGVNEDLAATAIWGTQQAGLFGPSTRDGVFGLWYGKGPGVDRSGDVFKHGNLAGSSPHGGVLLLAGDDHTCKSSTTAHQSEFAFVDAMIPVLNPAGVQDVLDLGLHGWAMSRFSGCWVAFKVITEMADSTASVEVGPERTRIVVPDDSADTRSIRWPDPPLEQERRLHNGKLGAVHAYAYANGLDRVITDPAAPARLGIASAGKSYSDVLEALDLLDLDLAAASASGIRLYKVALTWPLEPRRLADFAAGLDEILVVEEKRALIETQVRDLLYAADEGRRPRVIGKQDEAGAALLPASGELSPVAIARAIASRMQRLGLAGFADRLARLDELDHPPPVSGTVQRLPHFCSGCPHNTSTRVPEGSRAMAGIGCSYMAMWMDRATEGFTHMGAEGANWVGLAPFSATPHVFQNMGDGTYFHSGLMAIRSAVAARDVNMTYKVLYNDAVAMTGGQLHDGPLSPAMIAAQVLAEGVRSVEVVADDPARHPSGSLPAGVRVWPRDQLDAVQRRLRETPGVTVLIYDQTCAAEKRRRRKRGLMPDPARRVFINEAVCEGCGDCSRVSNCLSVLPLDTPLGRKRMIDQSSCNKDFSCVNGFCPSFVTVEGGTLRKTARKTGPAFAELPEPVAAPLDRPYGIIVTGVGGTGVVTVGALVGMAAHLEGKGCSVLDMTGLAQKYGAVYSHIRLAPGPDALHAVRLAPTQADLLIGCDLVVAAGADVLSRLRPGSARAVVNTEEAMTGEFTRNPDFSLPGLRLREAVTRASGESSVAFVEATQIATALLGDAIATNLFMLGYAFQMGWIPLSAAAIDRAIELNGVAVGFNREAFLWGRRTASDPASVRKAAGLDEAPRMALQTVDEIVTHRSALLTAYQDAAYAARYRDIVQRVRDAEARLGPSRALTETVARSLAKLMAYKDEYEVARLHSEGFAERVLAQFDGRPRLVYHLAPPLLSRRDPATGHLRKRAFGPWVRPAFKVLSRMRRLRGTALDPFGYMGERRRERRLIDEYVAVLEEIIGKLASHNHGVAVELAGLPDTIRGYGHVKHDSIVEAEARKAVLLPRLRAATPEPASVMAA